VPHIHEKIDFTVAIFIVHESRVLVIHHRNLNKWLPLGGHIELDEDPEQAALREAKEESGLDVELLGERPPTTGPGTRALIAPRFLDIHRITGTHEHIGMIYWARPRSADIPVRSNIGREISAGTDEIAGQSEVAADGNVRAPAALTLAVAEHHDIRWCSRAELEKLDPPMTNAVKWYCLKAIEEIGPKSITSAPAG
jgi:8-oxo-dGTP pyrophosphatase MutT (NUDIX family)